MNTKKAKPFDFALRFYDKEISIGFLQLELISKRILQLEIPDVIL
jgi:hypothetical protein